MAPRPDQPPTVDSHPAPAEPQVGPSTGRRVDTSLGRPPAAPPTLSLDPARTGGYAPADDPAAPLPEVAGYELLGELGRGGMGVVYKARHRTLDRVVALKMILAGAHARPQDLARFRAEAQAVARLQHPNIVQVFEVGEADGLPYCALEFVDGGTLAEKAGHEPQSPGAAARLVEQLARAVAYAHDQGVVHRDLKPSNVLVAQDGTAKVTDFGLARRLEGDAGRTRTGDVLGTPAYMAPEQARGDTGAVGPAVDVYGLGAVLYHLLTGRPPFAGASVVDVLDMVRFLDPVPPGQLAGRLPRDLDTITLKCLHKDPARRYASAGALADDLRRFLDGRPILARPVGPAQRAWRWARRNPWLAGLGTAVAVLLFAVAAVTSTLSYGLAAQKRELADQKRAAEATAQREQDARLAAQAAEAKAVAEQKQAEQARAVTAGQRQLALDTVRDVLIRVDEEMKKDARLAPLRVNIIRQMLTKVDDIRDHARKNPLADRTEATAYFRMGEIYLRTNRISDAAEWLGRAHKLFKAMADDAPADPSAARVLATACHTLAEAEWRLGHGLRSRELHADGLRLCQERVKQLAGAAEMEQADADKGVAESYALVAFDDLRLGEPERAVQNYLAADRAFAALPPPLPNWVEVRRLRNEIQVRLGDARSKLGQTNEAQTHYITALTAREDMVRNSPGPPKRVALIETDVGQSRMYLGDFHLMIKKDPAAAAVQYGMCLDLFTRVLADDPDNLDVRQRLAATHYRLGLAGGQRPGPGFLAGGLGEGAQVGVHHAEALRLREELAKIDQTDTQSQVEVLLSYARLGKVEDVGRTTDRLLEQAGKDRQTLFQTACGLAIVAAGKGEAADRCREQAFKVLGMLADQGWQDRVALETDPDFEAVRGDKRFAAILARVSEKPAEPD